jgi:hypothetical protein
MPLRIVTLRILFFLMIVPVLARAQVTVVSLQPDPLIMMTGDTATLTLTIVEDPYAGGGAVSLSSTGGLLSGVPTQIIFMTGQTVKTFDVTAGQLAGEGVVTACAGLSCVSSVYRIQELVVDPVPNLVSLTDVTGDQGGVLRLTWLRSQYDAPRAPVTITGYDVYRRIEEHLATSVDKLAGWDSVGWISAHGDSVYNFTTPTMCDSTAAGVCWSVYFVRATTVDPFRFYDSPPDSGYSTDNIAPTVPGGFQMDANSLLVWAASSEPDFQYYTVYGSAVGHLDETAVLIEHTIGTSLNVAGFAHGYFLLTASDYAGNESVAAVVDLVTPVPEALPTRFALHRCVPNPFNPATTISYDLPVAGQARLAIYDVAGRLVRVLVEGERAAGSHEAVWDGRDTSGRSAPSGSYLARLVAGGRVEAVRMSLVQ